MDREIRGESPPRDKPQAMLGDPITNAQDAYERVPSSCSQPTWPASWSPLSTRERRILRGRYGIDCPERRLREAVAAG